MHSELDGLFESTALEPPEGFAQRVMHRLENMPQIRKARGVPPWLPWAAVICGAVLGVGELASFMLAAWVAVAAN